MLGRPALAAVRRGSLAPKRRARIMILTPPALRRPPAALTVHQEVLAVRVGWLRRRDHGGHTPISRNTPSAVTGRCSVQPRHSLAASAYVSATLAAFSGWLRPMRPLRHHAAWERVARQSRLLPSPHMRPERADLRTNCCQSIISAGSASCSHAGRLHGQHQGLDPFLDEPLPRQASAVPALR